jgi:hypothetical protein
MGYHPEDIDGHVTSTFGGKRVTIEAYDMPGFTGLSGSAVLAASTVLAGPADILLVTEIRFFCSSGNIMVFTTWQALAC